ncbi:SanA/YdcF family protein [Nocardioides bruguierae]|uniref:SanA/YdcF family protein n=1 Tax=Nocardioides bruguierae TaxID=2945102 RepID=UPI002020765C|nr:ElyC/SanA/YdcF family protein [Nocardioides bruguierae]MCL8026083.1 YdcF family protein [Nocardioides bruguierae]
MRRALLGLAVGVPVLLVGLVAAANAVVLHRTDGLVTAEAEDVTPSQVAIVPGSRVLPDGTLGDVVAARVAGAVELYEAGLVDAVLVSGDNREIYYNEPEAMRRAVLESGVPPQDVFTDYAGTNTWATMRRAAEVFEVRSAVVVSQELYLPRTVDLGRAAGIDVQGLAVDQPGRARGGRETLARLSGLFQATVRPDVLLGPTIPITGDGRDSWA